MKSTLYNTYNFISYINLLYKFIYINEKSQRHVVFPSGHPSKLLTTPDVA